MRSSVTLRLRYRGEIIAIRNRKGRFTTSFANLLGKHGFVRQRGLAITPTGCVAPNFSPTYRIASSQFTELAFHLSVSFMAFQTLRYL